MGRAKWDVIRGTRPCWVRITRWGAAIGGAGARFGDVWRERERGRVRAYVALSGWALSGGQAAWRYGLRSPLQVGCRRIGRPGRYSTTSVSSGARWLRL